MHWEEETRFKDATPNVLVSHLSGTTTFSRTEQEAINGEVSVAVKVAPPGNELPRLMLP